VKTILLILASIAAVLLFAAGSLYLLGRRQPENHVAAIAFVVPSSRATVWAALTDYTAMPKWWPAVKSVRTETRPNGDVVTWTTDPHGNRMGFRTAESAEPSHLVREMVGSEKLFGGTWTYELTTEGSGTRITITERGYIKPPLFRGMAKLFMKPDATMRDFQAHFVPYLQTLSG